MSNPGLQQTSRIPRKVRQNSTKSSPHPDIFLYTDYRQFFKDWWTWQKTLLRTASFRALASKAGTSPSLFKDILDGRRRLSSMSVVRFAPAMGLSRSEASYLDLLADFGNARTVQEKNEAFEQMVKIRRRQFFKFLPQEQYILWSDPLHATLREFAGLESFQEDPAWIGKRLRPPVAAKGVQEAISDLEKNHILKRDSRGRLGPAESAVSSEDETPNQIIRHFNQEMIGLAISAPDRFPPSQREISGLTLGLSRDCYDRVKERIRSFKEDILEMVVEDNRGSVLVAQLNLQLFPLAILENSR